MNAIGQGPTTPAVEVLSACDALGYWRPRPGTDHDCLFFGVRADSDQAGPWDDTLGVVWWEGGRWRALLMRGTTDPGRGGTSSHHRALHPLGTAILQPGQYRGCWEWGAYRGEPALRQRPGYTGFRVWRDVTPDGRLDRTGPTHHDVLGLHWHRPYADGLVRIGLASLACQVPWSRRAHREAMAVARRQVTTHGWVTFSYTLLDVRERPELAALLPGGELGPPA